MLTRTVNGTTYTQVFDEENRLESVAVNGQTTYFYYDADGNRILTIYGAGASQVKVYTPFPDFEETITASGSTTQRTSYTLAGQLIAVRVRVGTTGDGTLRYAYTDHLGNVAALSYTGGTLVPNSLARYDPFGAFTTPPTTNPSITNHGFTGHQHNNTGTYDIELIYMNARYYLPEVGRFISPDSIVPEPSNPQSYNRYSYVRNSPLNFSDPTGHMEDAGTQFGGGSLQDQLTSTDITDDQPVGELKLTSKAVEGCDPVMQSCETNWVFANEEIRKSCNNGNCMNGHLWVYFGIPYTAKQRDFLVMEEAKHLCFEFGNCQSAQVRIMLNTIAPFLRAHLKIRYE